MSSNDLPQAHPSVPDITTELVEALERLYPNAMPEFAIDVGAHQAAHHLAFLQGQQSIINRLRFELERYAGALV